MTRKANVSEPSWRARIPNGVSAAILFVALISLGVARAFVGLHLGHGITVFSFSVGLLFCFAALYIHDRRKLR
jgi:hypothetical protein